MLKLLECNSQFSKYNKQVGRHERSRSTNVSVIPKQVGVCRQQQYLHHSSDRVRANCAPSSTHSLDYAIEYKQVKQISFLKLRYARLKDYKFYPNRSRYYQQNFRVMLLPTLKYSTVIGYKESHDLEQPIRILNFIITQLRYLL